MAANTDPDELIEERGSAAAAQLKKHDLKEAVHLDKVTDYVEEKEITGDTIRKVTLGGARCLINIHRLFLR